MSVKIVCLNCIIKITQTITKISKYINILIYKNSLNNSVKFSKRISLGIILGGYSITSSLGLKAPDTIHKKGKNIIIATTTNRILINDEWGKFFNKYRFLIGLSLDGPKDIHDRYRKSIGGKSVWHKVLNAVECLKRNKVEFNILCVISKANVNRVKEVYKFFLDNDFTYLQFIPALEVGDDGKKASFSINPTQYGKFLCQLFDEWKKKPNQVSIRTFNGILAHYHGYPKGCCTMEEECADYLLIEWNGDVYPCDFFEILLL